MKNGKKKKNEKNKEEFSGGASDSVLGPFLGAPAGPQGR